MCGIIGGVSRHNITPALLKGLKYLEYRGYDSAGIAVLDAKNDFKRVRSVGKITKLESSLNQTQDCSGTTGIAHTRWATHGAPTNENAHPHISCDNVSVVHNGIIENFIEIKEKLLKDGYAFTSDTDTEVIGHAISKTLKNTPIPREAVAAVTRNLQGSYSLGVLIKSHPGRVIATKNGSSMVIGISKYGHYIASDHAAFLDMTQQYIVLEDGDIAEITLNKITIYNHNSEQVSRPIRTSKLKKGATTLGKYQHFMQKEIFEQPEAIVDTLKPSITGHQVHPEAFGTKALSIFKDITNIHIIACGTSYHAGIIAKYWLEDVAKITTHVEIASEYRYRNPVIPNGTLFVTLSQSGETADTIAALRQFTKKMGKRQTLAITNSPESSIVEASNLTFLTHAGPEISVASTKAFTTQLLALSLLVTTLAKQRQTIDDAQENAIIKGLTQLPALLQKTLTHEPQIKEFAWQLKNKANTLFLGRGAMHAVAMEGALKLKELSYMHAEAYPAGELKHGPIALIDKDVPVIAIAPRDELLSKLESNLREVQSRGSQMIVFQDEACNAKSTETTTIIPITNNLGRFTAPIIFTLPLQLLSYHVALARGNDIDRPRNLAKSVTVE